jgi:hypothetical protein
MDVQTLQIISSPPNVIKSYKCLEILEKIGTLQIVV